MGKRFGFEIGQTLQTPVGGTILRFAAGRPLYCLLHGTVSELAPVCVRRVAVESFRCELLASKAEDEWLFVNPNQRSRIVKVVLRFKCLL